MFKRILCVLLAVIMILGLCACEEKIDNLDTPVVSDDENSNVVTQPVADDEITPPDVAPVDNDGHPADWKYSFGYEFIKENGIEYVWDRLDEDTRINLGEAMNAIRQVQLYCPLSVGMSKESASDFLELLTNCAIFYTYADNRYKIHMDEDGKVVGITINYRISYEEEAEERCASLESKLQEIVDGMPANGTEFEKLLYLHNYLVLNCDYGEDAVSPFTAYGSIVEGKATCQGYADGMHLLLSRAGFETMFVTGEGKNTAVKHKWCYVKMSDGHWYVIDPTWDDPENKEEPDYIGYDYFLITDEMILRDHAAKYGSNYYDPPVADGTTYNYYSMVGYVADDVDSAYEILKNQAIEMAEEGRRFLYLRVSDPDKLEDIYNELASGSSSSNKMVEIIKLANGVGKTTYSAKRWYKVLNNKLGTLVITLEYAE